MKVVGLVSGGKDSTFNLMQCVHYGHQLVAVANLRPADTSCVDADSWMYQTVGHQMINAVARCLGVPLFVTRVTGSARCTSLAYSENVDDEVEDLYRLLSFVQRQLPEVQAVSCGAILSNYQRIRVEHVCRRLGLVSLGFLWRRDQSELLREMIESRVDAVLLKVACMGLKPHVHLGKTLAQMRPTLESLRGQFGCNVCGEGGEYETFTLNCPLYSHPIVIQQSSVQTGEEEIGAVGVLQVQQFSTDAPEVQVFDADGFVPQRSQKRPGPQPGDGDAAAALDHPHSIEVVGDDARALMEQARRLICFQQVVAVFVQISDMSEFAAFNTVYRQYFDMKPTRAVIQPLDAAPLKIQMISSDDGAFPRTNLHVESISRWAPANIGPYSQALLCNSVCWFSGQIPLTPATMVVDCAGEEAAALTVQHCSAVLRAMSLEWTSVLLCTIFTTDCNFNVPAFANSATPMVNVVPVAALPRGASCEFLIVASSVDYDTEERDGLHLRVPVDGGLAFGCTKRDVSAESVSRLLGDILYFRKYQGGSAEFAFQTK